ncbi:MAG: isochorismatase [Gaiellaceae bacterium]
MSGVAREQRSPTHSGLEAPYEPRPIRFIRREDIDDWRLKLYGIALAGNEAREELVAATRDLAAAILPRPAVSDDRYGVGFATAHDAATFCIALIYWWQSANELHQRIYLSPQDDPAALTQVADQPAGCVWELAVVDFERRAWLEDVLANPSGPDVELYLERQFNADV